MGTWLVDSRAIAKKVRNASLYSGKQLKDCGAKRQCPNCQCDIDNSDVAYEWPGLPAGVKFDPSDAELLDHLAAKCGVGNLKPHTFIDEFIPTLDTEKGICYTHPKDLPGSKKDGSSIHFFHKTTNAYASGQRKRRKIESDQMGETVRWHKTGKTKPVVENGIHKGCKKIMVLYRGSKKGAKPEKSHWVMHQYHLGTIEDENEGDYVVSKILYQPPKQIEDTSTVVAEEESLPLVLVSAGPETPNLCPPKPGNSLLSSDANVEVLPLSAIQDPNVFREGYHTPSSSQPNQELHYAAPLAGESQAVEFDTNAVDDSLLCKEIFSSCAPLDGGFPCSLDNITVGSYCDGFNDLVNLELDTPPDFQLADLQFNSQDSIFDFLDPW